MDLRLIRSTPDKEGTQQVAAHLTEAFQELNTRHLSEKAVKVTVRSYESSKLKVKLIYNKSEAVINKM